MEIEIHRPDGQTRITIVRGKGATGHAGYMKALYTRYPWLIPHDNENDRKYTAAEIAATERFNRDASKPAPKCLTCKGKGQYISADGKFVRECPNCKPCGTCGNAGDYCPDCKPAPKCAKCNDTGVVDRGGVVGGKARCECRTKGQPTAEALRGKPEYELKEYTPGRDWDAEAQELFDCIAELIARRIPWRAGRSFPLRETKEGEYLLVIDDLFLDLRYRPLNDARLKPAKCQIYSIMGGVLNKDATLRAIRKFMRDVEPVQPRRSGEG